MSEPVLHVKELHYTYSDGTCALRGIDLTIARGEKVGLVGGNGSGKSTLLMCINGLFLSQGTVRVAGVELTAGRAKEIRGRVGLVFQSADDQLFMPTLADDLAFGPINLGLSETQAQQRVAESAEQMGLTELLGRAPHHLSMGQKRNAAIASVLALRPEILLMDEPSSSLDPRSRRRLITVLASLNTTMLIASHDLAMVAALCPRVAVIDDGRIVANGSTADIFRNAVLMEKHGLEAWPQDGS